MALNEEDEERSQIQIKPGGEWHRRAVTKPKETGCGELILGVFASRDYQIDEKLCQKVGCWSSEKRDTGRMKKLERDLMRDSDPALFHGDEEPTDPDGEDFDRIELDDGDDPDDGIVR